MEEGGERDLAMSTTALEDNTDATLSRLFGDSLQAATLLRLLVLPRPVRRLQIPQGQQA